MKAPASVCAGEYGKSTTTAPYQTPLAFFEFASGTRYVQSFRVQQRNGDGREFRAGLY